MIKDYANIASELNAAVSSCLDDLAPVVGFLQNISLDLQETESLENTIFLDLDSVFGYSNEFFPGLFIDHSKISIFHPAIKRVINCDNIDQLIILAEVLAEIVFELGKFTGFTDFMTNDRDIRLIEHGPPFNWRFSNISEALVLIISTGVLN